MAIFHLTAKFISRGKGQSAIAAAAYRSGERLRDEAAGEVKAYHARSERIVFTDIMAPKDAPEWAHDRNRLWNEAEQAEKRKDAQLAREIEVALPHELTEQQREWLVKDFAREAFVRKGYAVDIAIHAPDKESDERNHHAHLLVTRRTLGPEGFAKTKDWQLDKGQLEEWREQWAHLANRHLERHGHEARIDHRSLEAQGADREPGVHLGYAANEMTRRGAASDRMDELQGVKQRNDLRAEIGATDRELAALEKERGAAAAREAARAAAEAEAGRVAEVRAREAAAAQAQIAAQQAEALAKAKALTQDKERLARAAAEARLAAADKADQKALKTDYAAEKFAEGARGQAQDIRQERHDTKAQEQQDAWHTRTAEQKPPTGQPKEKAGGLRVTNAATGAVSSLGDFMTGFLANLGGGARPEPSKEPRTAGKSVAAFLMDPTERKRQQLERMAEREAGERDRKAIASMERDMKAGKALSSADIANLTRQHQEQIRHFGDDGVRRMVEEARREAEKSQGRERERD